MTNLVTTMQAMELCQRVLRQDDKNNDAKSVQSYIIATGFNEKTIVLPMRVYESYQHLASVYGLHYLVTSEGKQV